MMKVKTEKLTGVVLIFLIFALILVACSPSSVTRETVAETTTSLATTPEATALATQETTSIGKETTIDSEDAGSGFSVISAQITVDCQDAVNYGYEAAINVDEDGIIYDDTVELEAGATALDALYATGLVVATADSEYGSYVTSISSLAEGDCGSSSGWTFTINGEYPSTSADEVSVSDGDEVVWIMYCTK